MHTGSSSSSSFESSATESHNNLTQQLLMFLSPPNPVAGKPVLPGPFQSAMDGLLPPMPSQFNPDLSAFLFADVFRKQMIDVPPPVDQQCHQMKQPVFEIDARALLAAFLHCLTNNNEKDKGQSGSEMGELISVDSDEDDSVKNRGSVKRNRGHTKGTSSGDSSCGRSTKMEVGSVTASSPPREGSENLVQVLVEEASAQKQQQQQQQHTQPQPPDSASTKLLP